MGYFNYQIFAFCPLTNKTMCGLDTIEDDRDMKIFADFEK